jgi:hypothetical protein
MAYLFREPIKADIFIVLNSPYRKLHRPSRCHLQAVSPPWGCYKSQGHPPGLRSYKAAFKPLGSAPVVTVIPVAASLFHTRPGDTFSEHGSKGLLFFGVAWSSVLFINNTQKIDLFLPLSPIRTVVNLHASARI